MSPEPSANHAEQPHRSRDPQPPASIRITGVAKDYGSKRGGHRAVDGIELEIPAGRFVTLLGPSGCGKTTTLRMIAGFEDPTEGDILLDGASVLGVPADKRPMSMVFQSYALFPHLTVRDNVGFGLKSRRVERRERNRRVDDALTMMSIEGYADRYPHQLSGGQQQRVALARALVMEPRIVLFDEPLSNLDARLRVRMRDEIRSLQRRLGITAVFVTHDQSEALTMSDVIVVMRSGGIEQVGAPTDVYRRPVNRFVASFLGTSNFVEGTIAESCEPGGDASRYRISTPLGEFVSPGIDGLRSGDRATMVVRAEDLLVAAAPGGIDATVTAAAFDGDVINYDVDTVAGPLQARAPGAGDLLPAGAAVRLSIDSASLWVVAADDGTERADR